MKKNLDDEKVRIYYQNERPEMLDFVPESTKAVLEIGCGDGNFGLSIKNKSGAEVWGIEYEKKASEIARTKLDKVLHGDALEKQSELPTEKFDCIVMNDVLEHLYDPYLLLKKLKENLTPNGVIVCSIPNVRYFHVLKVYLLQRDWKYEDIGVMDRTHLRFFTKKSIVRMMDELDFDLIQIKGINTISSLKFNVFNMLTFGLFNDAKHMQYACIVQNGK